MSVTPQITLLINLLDYSGNQIGSVTQPAYVRIALCGYGGFVPRISGTGMMGKVTSWSQDIPYLGTQLTLLLFGNDVIAPAGTYYAITILDEKKQVVQAGAYQFNGGGTFDFSTIAQYLPPGGPNYLPNQVLTNPVGAALQVITGSITIVGNLTVTGTINGAGGLITVAFSTTPVFNGSNYPVVAFDMTLTGNVSSSTMSNIKAGSLVTFILIQDATGGRTFAFPANVKNPDPVDPTPSSINVQTFVSRANGNLYPIGPMTTN